MKVCLLTAWRDALEQGFAGGGSYALGDEGDRAISDLVDEILGEPSISSLASKWYIRNLAMKAIKRLLIVNEELIIEAVRLEVKKMLGELSGEGSEWTFVVPLVNVKIADDEPVSIGTVKLIHYSDLMIGSLDPAIKKFILSVMTYGKKVGESEEEFINIMKTYDYASVTVEHSMIRKRTRKVWN